MPSRHEPTGPIHPTIDGHDTSYYEWLYAGLVDFHQQYAAIQRSAQCVRALRHGFDQAHQYLRFDLDLVRLGHLVAWSIDLTLSHSVRIRITPDGQGIRAHVLSPHSATVPCALARILEIEIPNDLLGLRGGEKLELTATLLEGGEVLERYPAQGRLELLASAADLEPHV